MQNNFFASDGKIRLFSITLIQVKHIFEDWIEVPCQSLSNNLQSFKSFKYEICRTRYFIDLVW